MVGKIHLTNTATPIFALLFFTIFMSACKHDSLLQEQKLLDYPSASGIEYFNKHLYIIGDDAGYLLITDSSLAVVDSFSLYSLMSQRIPKNVKPDLEAITLMGNNKLLILGSGSVAPYRNAAWILDPIKKTRDSLRLDTFYKRITLNGLPVLNIEGVAFVPGGILISNRGNKGFPKNHLIFTSNNFWHNQSAAPINVVCIGTNTDTSIFNGVSGMTYSTRSDQLILTVSTEDTKNATDDGAIGKSYLWIVNSITSKKNGKAINPNRIIDLADTDPAFKGQKIESVCILNETDDFFYLVLSADNDNGKSTLFRMVVEK